MKKIIVAIDGYSGCGKSTIAKQLAQYAGYTYIDTGAMYRTVGLWARRSGYLKDEDIDLEAMKLHLPELDICFRRMDNGAQHIFLAGEDVESSIRTIDASEDASRVSTIGFVREKMVDMQRVMGKEKGIVMDGRDIGTVVFPQAELKLFVCADARIRADRRFDELQSKGEKTTWDEVLKAIEERDYRDTHRKESPLLKAEDAILLDNSHLTCEQQLEKVIEIFNDVLEKTDL